MGYVRHADEDKARIINAAIPQLANGTPTEVIAAQYGISGRTLRHWLIHDDDAAEARSAFLTGQMMDALQDMDAASDQLPLARAREKFKSYAWLAERRLPDKFGQKREVSHTHKLDMSQALADARAMLQGRPQSVTGDMLNAHVIDSTVHASSPAQIEQGPSTTPPPSDAGQDEGGVAPGTGEAGAG